MACARADLDASNAVRLQVEEEADTSTQARIAAEALVARAAEEEDVDEADRRNAKVAALRRKAEKAVRSILEEAIGAHEESVRLERAHADRAQAAADARSLAAE